MPLVLALALVLRLYGIDWDGGGLYHPDERAILTHTYDLGLPALSNLGILFNADESPLNPRWFPYGTLPIYALKALQLAISPLTNLDIVELSRVGRVLSALADTATVAVVYKLGLLLFNRRVGLLAAGLVAMAVLAHSAQSFLCRRDLSDAVHYHEPLLHGAGRPSRSPAGLPVGWSSS